MQDVATLKSQLPKLMNFILVDNPYCNHLDFIWSINVNSQINDPIKAILKETDDMDWKYTGPSPSTMNQETSNDALSNTIDRMPNVINNMDNLEFFEDNLDTIITQTMPRSIEQNGTTEFQQQRKFLNIILRKLLKFVKYIDKEKQSLWNKLSKWNDYMTTRLASFKKLF